MSTSLLSISVGAVLLPAAYHFMEGTESNIETSVAQNENILRMSHGVRTRTVAVTFQLQLIMVQVSIVLLFSKVSPFLLHFLALVISLSLFCISCIPTLVAQTLVSRPSQ